jgi:probable HAF family extracellular repeat protein
MTDLIKNMSCPLHNHLDNQKGNFRRIRILAALVFIALALTLTAPWAQATDYKLTSIDYTGEGVVDTHASGINNLGQVVGTYHDVNGFDQSFIYDNGSFTLMPTYKLSETYTSETMADDINDAGQVCGSYTDSTGQQKAFIYYNNNYTPLLYGNGTTTARGINNNNEVIGHYGNSGIYFRDSSGSYSSITLDNNWTQTLRGLNDNDIAVGYDFLNYVALIYNITYNQLSSFAFPTQYVPNGLYLDYTDANDINNDNTIVGSYGLHSTDLTAGGSYHYYYYGFVKQGDSFTTIAYPGAAQTYVEGINDSGQIVGEYYDSDGFIHGFIGNPVATPISPSWLLLGTGLLGLVAMRRRRP